MKKVSISPMTRLEGHGKIDILLDDNGDVADAYLQVVELRGFEKFCEGRPVEEMPRITPKICGVCPGAHHMASAKACDAVYGVAIPPAAEKLRELYYHAHIAHSHMLHFFALAGPDFIPGAGAPPERRNVLGLIDKLGLELGRQVLKHRGFAQKIQGIIAGHPIHPVAALPGGMAKPLGEAERDAIEPMAESMVGFAEDALDLFANDILGDPGSAGVIESDTYHHQTHYAGLVDDEGRVSLYDGKVRVVGPFGDQVALFEPAAYLDHIAERVVPWTYLKLPYLKKIGWKGMVEGPDSGVYRVNALARLNVARGMSTPKAQGAYERFYDYFGTKPVHHTLAYHWARLIECLHATEVVLNKVRDPEIVSTHVRAIPTGKPSEAVAAVEAPRGTLYHHYVTDSRGLMKSVNLIVATVQNNAAMNMSVKKAAQSLIHGGEISEGLLDRVEMAFRAYDPCLACASHALPGRMPLEVTIRRGGRIFRRLLRDGS